MRGHSMPRDRERRALGDRVRIEHMLLAARDVAKIVEGHRPEDLRLDMVLARALANAVQEIGEAAAQVSDAGRQQVPGLPWREIVAMRNLLVHVYWGISPARLWDTATIDVPELLVILENACAQWPPP